MIVSMQKVLLLVSRKQASHALHRLQDLGVMHLAPERLQSGVDLENARQRLDQLRDLEHLLVTLRPRQQTDCSAEKTPAVEELLDLAAERKELLRRRKEVQAEYDRYSPYGDFDPGLVRDLRAQGLDIRLVQTRRDTRIELPEDVVRLETARTKTYVFSVLVRYGQLDLPVRDTALPERSVQDMRDELEAIDARVATIDTILRQAAPHCPPLATRSRLVRDAFRYYEARSGMEELGPALLVRGYIPRHALSSLQTEAQQRGWGILTLEPEPEEIPPTLLRLPRWVRPIKAVFELIGVLPGYYETDISVPFLLFLSLFFAMIVGDAGYGLVFLGLTWVGRRLTRLPRDAVILLTVMSLCTVGWGLAAGNFFGLDPTPGIVAPLQLGWLSGPEADSHLMLLCFVLGGLQLTIGHTWRALLFFPHSRFLAQVGWILVTWGMFFAARSLVLLARFPTPALLAIVLGGILVVGFQFPLRQFKRYWTEYVRFPLDLISSFVDVVSYIRLFAVGSATFAIANAFNEMAAGIGAGTVWGPLLAALILFFGHCLNILLAGMGVLVHGVRLNTLEFAGHTGIQWTGQPFSPFARSLGRGRQ